MLIRKLLLLFAFIMLFSCASFLPEERATKPRKKTTELIKECIFELNQDGNSLDSATKACLEIYKRR